MAITLSSLADPTVCTSLENSMPRARLHLMTAVLIGAFFSSAEASMTVADIDRWQRGMIAELATERMKAAGMVP